jgi:two-component system nitrate/nitrite response regulator NarL
MPTASSTPIRILLIDDHTLVRAGLVTLIKRHPGLMVVGEAANRTGALALAVRDQPDIILLDLDLGGENNLDFLPALQTAAPAARVILLTSGLDPEVHHRAVRRGAMGVVLKGQVTEVLIKAIERVQAGEVWLDRSMMARLLAKVAPTLAKQEKAVAPEAVRIATLTAREREVIALIVEGLKNKQIAERLVISEATVDYYLRSIFDKLGITNRLELVVYAYRYGLAKPPR